MVIRKINTDGPWLTMVLIYSGAKAISILQHTSRASLPRLEHAGHSPRC